MPFITFLGDGFFILITAIFFLLFKNRTIGWTILITYAFSSLITQLLKNLVFPSEMRPITFFRNVESFHWIKGLTYHEFHSFPSGHATSIFALTTVLVIFYGNKIWKQIMFLLLACFVSLSRVYLSQHFLIDIYFGAIIGVLTTLLICLLISRKNNLNHNPYLFSNG